jgi:hypothetical protein
MIHKRFNYSRHLIWAGVFLTVFVSSAVTHKYKGKQEITTIQPATLQTALLNTLAQK